MIIYVEENKLINGSIHSVKGFMSEKTYAALYQKDSLDHLIRDKTHGSELGSNKWMYSEIITHSNCNMDSIYYLNDHLDVTL